MYEDLLRKVEAILSELTANEKLTPEEEKQCSNSYTENGK
jgi:hypothetical protein